MDSVRLHALRLSPVKTLNPYSGQGSQGNDNSTDYGNHHKRRLT
jgi:hypothetical protein